MQVNLVQCDVCQSRHETDADQRLKFAASFSGATDVQPFVIPEMDVCPDCRERLHKALTGAISRIATPTHGPTHGAMESIEVVEQRHIMAVLTSTDWNKSRAALILGITRSTLDRKLKRYRASRPVVSQG